MKLRSSSHVEHPGSSAGSCPTRGPSSCYHDQVVSDFWPQLYEVYPDFQFWVLDGRRLIGYACTLPVAWDGGRAGAASTGGDRGAGRAPTTLCASSQAIVQQYRRPRRLAPSCSSRMRGSPLARASTR